MAATSTDRELQRLLQKDVLEWSVADVAKWLKYIDLADYSAKFIENSVSGLELVDLDLEEIESLGIKSIGHKKRLQASIRRLVDNKETESSAKHEASDSGSEDSFTSSNASTPSSSSASGIIACKVFYHEKTVAFSVKTDCTLSELKAKVKDKFRKEMKLQYKDDEDDLLPLTSEKDWRTAMKLCGDRIRIYCKSSSSRSNSSARRVDTQKRELAVLESLADPVIMINETGEITFFNSAAEKVFGYRRAAVIGENVKMLMPDEHALNHDRYLSNYLRTGIAKVVGTGRQLHAIRKNGDKFPVFLTISESKTRRNRSFIGTLQDLSNRADADITKVDQTTHYTLLESILDAACVINEVGIVQFWNSAGQKLLGFRPSEVIGKNVKMLMSGKDKRDHDDYLSRYLQTGNATVIGKGRDVVACHKDGSLIPVHLSVSEQVVGSKRLYTGIVRPTAVQEAEAKVSVLEEQREAVDNLVVGGVVIDDHGEIKAFNDTAQELFGYSLIEVIGKNVKMIMPPQVRTHHDDYLKKWRETGEEHVFGVGRDLTAQHKNGSQFRVRLAVTKRKDETGRFLCTGTIQTT